MRPRYLCVLALALLLAPAALAQRAAEEARAHLQRNASHYGLSTEDLADLAVTDVYTSRRSGTTHVYLRQRAGGIEIAQANFTVALSPGGRVFHAVGGGAVLAGQRLSTSPSVGAEAAATALAHDAGLVVTEPFRVVSAEGERSVVLSDGGVSEEQVPVDLVYHLGDDGRLTLAWEVGLYEVGAQHYWLGYVDATTGTVLLRHDLVVHDHFVVRDDLGAPPAADAGEAVSYAPLVPETAATGPLALAGSYKVYALPVESPIHTRPLPPADGRVLVANADDPVASPFGWHDTDGAAGAEYTITRGNNVHAYLDRVGGGGPDPNGSPDGGASLTFDFPIDHTQNPVTYGPAAVTNLFYTNNVFHDVLYQYGFDEAAGNFQVNNYGNGGRGGDDVRAEAQDGAQRCHPIPLPFLCLNNANFFTPPDGERPRMQMFEWTETSPRRDGDLDNGVILHEYGHGVSNRLTGGPSNVDCLNNAEQMGEGWSDYFAALLTVEPGDTRTQNRGIGNYPLGLSPDGQGIREYPYNTDFAVNPQTYAFTRTAVVPHGVGSVWAMTLWEATWDMIDAYGFDPDLYEASGTAGNQVILQLVVEGMKLQPCSPGFVDGRDAILAADVSLYGGEHLATLWAAFARRGLGAGALQGSSNSNADNVEDFTVPGGSLILSLVPDDPPVVVPRGGTVGYTATLTVPEGGPTSLDYWAEAILPGGQVVLVFGPGTVNVTPGTFSRSLAQQVPVNAPLGEYTYTMRVGTYPDVVLAQDGFPFTVTAAGLAARGAGVEGDAWRLYDHDGALLVAGSVLDLGPTAVGSASAASEVPAVPALHAAYPNPSSGTTTLRYDVAEAGPVRLSVYDALGREVAVVVDGTHEAGRHAATLDGRGLPAGVYLVRLAAGGAMQTRRFTLVQ